MNHTIQLKARDAQSAGNQIEINLYYFFSNMYLNIFYYI
jgi:hypothetical protein